jgi:DNA-binding CsgD family transcriptional regulator
MPMPLVGRAAALDELRSAWAPRAGFRPVVVTGDAGTGKSALVRAALDAIGPPLVLAGAARVHSPAPYDWLAAVLTGRDVTGLPVPADALAWLAQDPDVPRERYAPEALLRLAVAAVRSLVGAGPAALVVEDLHALDPASLNLVAELATAGLPALLLVTSRPAADAVSPELVARTLARLSGTGAVRRHLTPLRVGQVAELLRRAHVDATPELARAVWQRTGGNPYELAELLATADGDPAVLAGAGPAASELTAREVEVLGCLAAGMTNKQVAHRLGISVRTVTVHVSNLLRKTESASRTEAALWAVRRGLGAPALTA